MKSSQLIKIDSISSRDNDKKEEKTVAAPSLRDVLEPSNHFERERPIHAVCYMSNELWARIKRYTHRTIAKNGGNGSNTLFQFTHTPKKTFFLSFRKPVHFILYSYMKLHTFTHALNDTREAKRARTPHCVQYHSFSRIEYWPSKWNKKAENSERKNVIGRKKLALERWEREKFSRDFCMFCYLVPHEIVKPSDSEAKNHFVYVFAHTRPCMRAWVCSTNWLWWRRNGAKNLSVK